MSCKAFFVFKCSIPFLFLIFILVNILSAYKYETNYEYKYEQKKRLCDMIK